ncbi:MAG: PorT family protein [Saprospiraceae bacterium]|nr:PorT family protein [Saprospiraceae bacterium]
MQKIALQILPVLGLLMVGAASIGAQAGLRFSLGGAYANSGWDGDAYGKRGYTDVLPSYALGLSYTKSWGEKLAGMAEFQVARKGYAFKIHNYLDRDRVKAQRTMYAASLYVLPQYTLYQSEQKKKTVAFGIQLGAYGSFLFAHRWKFADRPAVYGNDATKTFDAGLTGGFFLKIKKPKQRLLTWDIRYSNGLLDVSRSPAFDLVRLRYFEIGFGVGLAK